MLCLPCPAPTHLISSYLSLCSLCFICTGFLAFPTCITSGHVTRHSLYLGRSSPDTYKPCSFTFFKTLLHCTFSVKPSLVTLYNCEVAHHLWDISPFLLHFSLHMYHHLTQDVFHLMLLFNVCVWSIEWKPCGSRDSCLFYQKCFPSSTNNNWPCSRCSTNKWINTWVILIDLRSLIFANLNLFITCLIPALSWPLTVTSEVCGAWKNSSSSEALEALLGQQRLFFS